MGKCAMQKGLAYTGIITWKIYRKRLTISTNTLAIY
jgi:hypothetical protein